MSSPPSLEVAPVRSRGNFGTMLIHSTDESRLDSDHSTPLREPVNRKSSSEELLLTLGVFDTATGDVKILWLDFDAEELKTHFNSSNAS